jgi:hypothetical protein
MRNIIMVVMGGKHIAATKHASLVIVAPQVLEQPPAALWDHDAVDMVAHGDGKEKGWTINVGTTRRRQ